MSLTTKINCKREQLRKLNCKIEDPDWQDKQNAKARERYAANPEPRLSQTKKWQKNNKEKVNAAKRKWHSIPANRDKKNKALREARRLKRIGNSS